ncbi:hypothetical protein [Streptomonospora salina]|uniref:Uncharacterized protein n=1 Tax=Streptomonospora salina TaxID=104205 RepID=A0A841DZR5_9ACTN|nr:hypothetical protein [Streptomonospora salina]MBB5996276.1 hypothetical protein [Streptomonospora salina]
MIDEFRAAFQELIDASVSTDPGRFPAAVQRVLQLAPEAPPSERELALEALGPFIGGGHTAPGITADLAVVAGAFVEMGADPGPAGAEAVGLLRSVGQGAAVFLHAWERTGGGRPPEPDDVTAAAEERVAQRLGESAPTATVCWWTVRRYGLAAKTMLSQSGVRSTVRADPGLRAELVAIANQLSGALSEFGEIRALLRMAEATSALVLDRATGRGFRVLFDGIGDNFQLHTLLADALLGSDGRGLPGRRPDPRWVAAFRDSPPDPQARVVQGWWNLVALDGSWVRNEGVPADIPAVDGEHVLVLDEQPFPRSWNAGRRHPMVRGWLEADEEVSAEEAAAWWRRAAPAATGARSGAGSAAEPAGAGISADAPRDFAGDADPGHAPGERGEPAPGGHEEPSGPQPQAVDGGAAVDEGPGSDLGGLVRPYVGSAPLAVRIPDAVVFGAEPAGGGDTYPGFVRELSGADGPGAQEPEGRQDGHDGADDDAPAPGAAAFHAAPPEEAEEGPPPWPGAPGETALQEPSAPEETASQGRAAPVTETAALPVVPDAAAEDDGGTRDRPERSPGTPGLPPLPPGVSTSSAWGPDWR